MNDEYEMKPDAGISLLSSKNTKETPGLTFRTDGRIAICPHVTCTVEGYNSDTFGTETSD
jgi:hypothetical protein